MRLSRPRTSPHAGWGDPPNASARADLIDRLQKASAGLWRNDLRAQVAGGQHVNNACAYRFLGVDFLGRSDVRRNDSFKFCLNLTPVDSSELDRLHADRHCSIDHRLVNRIILARPPRPAAACVGEGFFSAGFEINVAYKLWHIAASLG
jgi:hypothetical protein